MCGIAGVILAPNVQLRPGVAEQMLAQLNHRGPDGQGWLRWSDGPVDTGTDWREGSGQVILLHRRLAILDLGAGGQQPMSTHDGRYHIVFNGEIYNYVELREELKKLGFTFRTRSDTEVLLAAYAQWGTGAITKLTGMFSFCLLDTWERKVVLARDHFGIKPLYYTITPHGMAFASEIKALLNFPGVGRRANARSLRRYLTTSQTDSGDETMFAAVAQLPAAHFAIVDVGSAMSIEPKRYWQINSTNRTDISFAQASELLRERFLESVKMHLRSDVPVGAALSGGIDSSAIVSAMRQITGNALDLHTFSFIPNDMRISEERWVDIVASHVNPVVHKVRPGSEDLADDLKRLVYVQEQPFGSTSIFAQHRVFQAVHAAGIKVVLDGQGADELLAGYRWFPAVRLATLIRRGQLGSALEFVHRSRHWINVSPLLAQALWTALPDRIKNGVRFLSRRESEPAWLDQSWFNEQGEMDLEHMPSPRSLHEDLENAVTNTMLPMLLRYEDRNSMAFSVESRVPFLTPAIAEFVFSLPESYVLGQDATSKHVFREAMRGVVPDPILNRRDKIGFVTPEKQWLTSLSPWVERVLNETKDRRVPAFNADRVEHMWRQMLQGGKGSFTSEIWRWLNVCEWSNVFEVTYN